jgi:hypothetical protein
VSAWVRVGLKTPLKQGVLRHQRPPREHAFENLGAYYRASKSSHRDYTNKRRAAHSRNNEQDHCRQRQRCLINKTKDVRV